MPDHPRSRRDRRRPPPAAARGRRLPAAARDPARGDGGVAGARISLPHIGWNRLHDESGHPLLAGIPSGSYFYFVHSYAPLDAGDACLARATHGASFVAVAGRGRVFGTQFHPEKSGRWGLRLLGNYLGLKPQATDGRPSGAREGSE